jgi:hypothetical protein
MQATARLAGFFAAHGIWSVSDGGPLIPLVGYEDADGSRGMDRLVVDDSAAAARVGQEALQAKQHGSVRAVLVIDAYVNLATGRTDALILDAVEFGPTDRSLKMAIPYRPQAGPLGFAVHRPKFIKVMGVDEPDYAALGDAFFAGVDSHEKAATIWNTHLDPSI